MQHARPARRKARDYEALAELRKRLDHHKPTLDAHRIRASTPMRRMYGAAQKGRRRESDLLKRRRYFYDGANMTMKQDPVLKRCREIIAEASMTINEYLSEFAGATIEAGKLQQVVVDTIATMIFEVFKVEQKAMRAAEERKKHRK